MEKYGNLISSDIQVLATSKLDKLSNGLRLIGWLLILVLFLVVGYAALFEFISNRVGYDGVDVYLWPFCYIGLILLIFSKIKTLTTPIIQNVITKTFQIIEYLPVFNPVKLSYPSPFNFPVFERFKSVETKHGIIYIMRREDGVLKFGKTQNLRRRFKDHCKNYEAGFNLVTSWAVPELDKFEKDILVMSEPYKYIEGQRQELRQMTDQQLTELIFNFTDKVHRGWVQ